MTRHDHYILLEDPEKELKLWLVDIEGKPDGEAISAAWKLVDASFARTVEDEVTPPDPDGWDSVMQRTYKASVAEGRFIVGASRSKDGNSFVALIDGPVTALQRRGAQLGQIVESQKAPGLVEESFAGKKAAKLDDDKARQLSAFIEEVRSKLDIPGAAVAVVQDGQVVFEKGFGVRRLGQKQPVTPDTMFMIGSTTKSLTSLMAAVMVDKGQLSWSDPLEKLLPQFSLADKQVASKVELQHSFCACTGLPRQDMEFLFEYRGTTVKKRLAELATMKPTTGFGETFQYSNALVSAGGFAAAHKHAPKKTLMPAYEAAMQELVFGPLGMTRTTFRRKVAARGDHARPHGRTIEAKYSVVPLDYEDAVTTVAPAGGAWSTVRDLARYVQLELAEGKLPDGKQLVSKAALLERPQAAGQDRRAQLLWPGAHGVG